MAATVYIPFVAVNVCDTEPGIFKVTDCKWVFILPLLSLIEKRTLSDSLESTGLTSTKFWVDDAFPSADK